MRHARAAEASPGVDDHERPLTEAGLRQARRLAEEVVPDLAEAGCVLPTRLFSSCALRARMTAEAIAHALPGVRVELSARIYRASPEEVLGMLGELAGEHQSVMVVGHNPTVHLLASGLLGAAKEHVAAPLGGGSGAKMPEIFPTAGMAVVAIDCPSFEDALSVGGSLAGFGRG